MGVKMGQHSGRKRRGRIAPPSAMDAGSAEALARGETVLTDAADPDAPARTIRRAERAARHVTAWRRGEMSKAQFVAASMLAEVCDRAAGARDGTAAQGPRAAPWWRMPPVGALNAVTALRRAEEAVGEPWAFIVAYVRDNRSIEAVARLSGLCRNRVAAKIRDGLDALADHWRVRR